MAYRPFGFTSMATAFFLSVLALLSGCGGGRGDAGVAGGGSTPTTGTTTASASVTLTLTDPTTGLTRNSISGGAPAKLTVIVKNASGSVVPDAVVIFSTDSAYGSFTPSSTALTDNNGTAWVTLNSVGASGGASTVTVTTQVGGTAVSGSLNYAVGASNSISLGLLTFDVSPLSAYGTTSVSVTVNGTTSPLAVSFTSNCASSGKASLTSSVTTVNGVATASYLDNGCSNTDSVTATVTSGVSASGNLVVKSPSAGSLQFVSVAPANIALKGTGGTGRQETSHVTFRLVDTAGHPFGGQPVNFALNTSQGGLHLSSTSAFSDAATGNVVTDVISGTISTSVRVTATSGMLSTQSDQLVISTGIPSQDSFSLSATQHNIEGWSRDGVKTTLTARLADHFHNPVPDGTAVYFTSEGGSVEPSCTTVGGACSVVLTSQNLRPDNGRVTVLARAIGEEAFTDLNGNGTVDNTGEMIDAKRASTDMGDAFVDFDENGVRDSNEPFFDFRGNGYYTAPANAIAGDVLHKSDGKYRGLLCTTGNAICSDQKTIDVRGSQIIIFSSSFASITLSGSDVTPGTQKISLPKCTVFGAGAPTQFIVTILDLNGNAMPTGTTVSFATTNGTITSDTSIFPLIDSIGCRTSSAGCPASAASSTFGDYYVTMKSDAAWAAGAADGSSPATCTDTSNSGTFTVNVTTPMGSITKFSVDVTD